MKGRTMPIRRTGVRADKKRIKSWFSGKTSWTDQEQEELLQGIRKDQFRLMNQGYTQVLFTKDRKGASFDIKNVCGIEGNTVYLVMTPKITKVRKQIKRLIRATKIIVQVDDYIKTHKVNQCLRDTIDRVFADIEVIKEELVQ